MARGVGGVGAAAGNTTESTLAWPAALDGKPANIRRLSRDEIITSMQSIIGVAPSRQTLPVDHRTGHNSLLDTAGLGLLQSETQAMSLALESVATTGASAVLARSTCATTGQAQRDCLGMFARQIAEKAFRRPLSTDEGTRLDSLFAAAGTRKNDDIDTVDSLIRAVFFSPSFLYRTELGVVGADGARTLTALEIATRLSFLATLGPPDALLADAAKAGSLAMAAERVKHFDRLAKTDAGIRAMTAFVLEHLGATESKVLEKSAAYQSGLPSGYAASIRASAVAIVSKALRESADPSLATLLASTDYADDTVVKTVTQAAGSGQTATGDNGEITRMGMLMHPHVLASHTKEQGVSPFVVGGFIRESLLCDPLPQPPADAALLARADPPAGSSLREDFVYRTSPNTACVSCHNVFSPLGYSFLPFDPIGRWLRKDPSGKPWDLGGSVPTYSGVDLVFDSPTSLAQSLANHPQVHGCFAQSAVTWALGRHPTAQERPLLAAVAEVSSKTKGQVAAVLRKIVESPVFITTIGPR